VIGYAGFSFIIPGTLQNILGSRRLLIVHSESFIQELNMIRVVITYLFILTISMTVMAVNRIVAKTGGDFSTIMAGLNAANAGDTVFVKAGTYSEIIKWPKSGSSSAGYIVLKAFGDGPAIISGASLTAAQNTAELILVDAKSYIAIIGMEIGNYTTAAGNIFLKGIQVQGASQHILIKQCKVHDITTTNTTTNAGANAIGIFGSNGTTSITDIAIDSCEVYNNLTGYSEAVSIDGNVDGFRITRNYVHDNNNIGILIAGYYGESPNPATDQARHGIVSDNRVERCSSCNNPSYQGDCSADGIYSDGGGKSVFERNIISECDIGFEAGAELAAAIDDSMIVRDNLIMKCNTGGMFIGGYATARGWTIYCRVENNTFYMNDVNNTGSGEFLIQKSHDNIIRNNIFYTTSQKAAVSVAFNASYCYSNTVDNNLFYSASGSSGIDGISLDTHAKTGDPLFVNASSNDFHLQSGSAAKDACAATYAPAIGELDLGGSARLFGSAVDIGAYEYGSSATRFTLTKSGFWMRDRIMPRLVINASIHAMPRVYITGKSNTFLLPNGRTALKTKTNAQ
jgi:hypothetical protein